MNPLTNVIKLSEAELHQKNKTSWHDQYKQGRLEACSTCSKHTGAEGVATVNKAPNALGNGAKRQMNTVKFWLEPALNIKVNQESISEIQVSTSIVYYSDRLRLDIHWWLALRSFRRRCDLCVLSIWRNRKFEFAKRQKNWQTKRIWFFVL